MIKSIAKISTFAVLFLCLSGCIPAKPNARKVAISKSTTYLAKQLDRAERIDWISNQKENQFMDDFVKIDRFLLGQNVFFDGYDCEGKTQSECIDVVLDSIEAVLIEAEKKNGR